MKTEHILILTAIIAVFIIWVYKIYTQYKINKEFSRRFNRPFYRRESFNDAIIRLAIEISIARIIDHYKKNNKGMKL